MQAGAVKDDGVVQLFGLLDQVTVADLFLCFDHFPTTAKDQINPGGVEELVGDGGGDRGIRLVGKKCGDPWRSDGSGGNDADCPSASLGLIKKRVRRFAVVPKAKLVGGTDLPRGEEGGESSGIADELVRGVGFHEGHGVGLVETGKVAIGMAGLSKGEEFRAGPRNEENDDGMGAGADEVADVAVGEADEGHQDDQGNQLRAPTFHKGLLKQNRLRGRCG